MAVKTVQAAGSAAAGTRTDFLSPPVLEPARLLNVAISWSAADAGDTIRVFITRSPTPVSEPQPGDPPVLYALDIQFGVTATAALVIPLFKREMIQPPFRLALSYNNVGTAAKTVSAVLFYDTEPE